MMSSKGKNIEACLPRVMFPYIIRSLLVRRLALRLQGLMVVLRFDCWVAWLFTLFLAEELFGRRRSPGGLTDRYACGLGVKGD